MRFCYRMVPEVYQLFWAAMARGEFITDAAANAGMYRKQCTRWLVAAVEVRPRRGRGLKGRSLSWRSGRRSRSAALGVSRSARSLRRSGVHRRRCRGSGGATATDWAATGLPRRMPWLMTGRRGPAACTMSDSRIGGSAFRFDTALLILIVLDRETIALKSRCVHVAAEGIPG